MENQDNMPLRYKTILRPGSGEITVKKSRFIASISPVASPEEAAEFIEACKKRFWDARHNPHAYVVGIEHERTKCSDDGEPAQTAGKPMLDVLLGAELKNVVSVVTRYFGGTLLGTGGLVRAYSSALVAGLEDCRVVERRLCQRISAELDYSVAGKLEHLIAGGDIITLSTEYSQKAGFQLLVPVEELGSFKKKLADISGGQALVRDLGQCYGSKDEGVI